MHPNNDPLTNIGIERFPRDEVLPPEAHFAGCLAVGPVFVGGEIPVRTEARVYDEGTPVTVTENQLKAICEANNLSFGNGTWGKLQNITTERFLFTPREPDVSRKLYLDRFSSVLRDAYRTDGRLRALKSADRTTYTLNLLTDYLVPAEAERLPEVTVPTKQCPELDDCVVADACHIEAFADSLGISLYQDVAQDTLKRIAARAANRRHGRELSRYPDGKYRVDELIVEVFTPRANFPNIKKIRGHEISIPALAETLHDLDILTGACVRPKTHYVLTRYIRALRNALGFQDEMTKV
jgi:hypothetical protein